MAEELRPDYQGEDNANAAMERYVAAVFSGKPPVPLHPSFAAPGSYSLFLAVADGDRSEIHEARAIAEKARPIMDQGLVASGSGDKKVVLTSKGSELLANDSATSSELPPGSLELLRACARGELEELERGYKLAQAVYSLVNQGLITGGGESGDPEAMTLTEWGQKVLQEITTGTPVPSDGRFA